MCLAAVGAMAQPAGGFGGFQQQAKLETSQEWKDVNYAGDDKAYHTCDIYLPKKEAKSYPVVIHIYGSAWFSNSSKGMADIGTIVKTLLDNGYAVVCPNHRSSMDAKWPAQIHDIRAVIRFVRGNAKQYKFDTSFIATSGFSSGGHLASIAATTSGVKQTKVGTVDIDLEGTVGNFLKEKSTVNAACDWSGPVDLTAMDCGEIFDIVSSGSTLIANGLKEVETVFESEAVLIARPGLSEEEQALVDDLLFRIESENVSRGKKYLLMNLPKASLEEAIRILPAMRSPTVMPLASEDWCSLHSVIDAADLWTKVRQLKAIGAEGILVMDVDKIIL